ncbi:MAG: HD domain-containing protein, partial [Myxococcota bacterium]
PQTWLWMREQLQHDHALDLLQQLYQTKLFHWFLPLPQEALDWELDQSSNHYHHETVWAHTCSVIRALLELFPKYSCSPETRLRLICVALFHDVGKLVPERGHQIKPDGYIRFAGHPMISDEIASATLKLWNAEPQFADQVVRLVRLHDRVLELKAKHLEQTSTPSFFTDLFWDCQQSPQLFRELCLFAIADRIAHAPGHDDPSLMEQLLHKAESSHPQWTKLTTLYLNTQQIAEALELPTEDVPHRLQKYLRWTQTRHKVADAEQMRVHLQQLRHLAQLCEASWSDRIFLDRILSPLQKSWPVLDAPITQWIGRNHHRLHWTPKQKQPMFSFLLEGHTLEQWLTQVSPPPP